MSAVSKALQFMDKKDLECAICLNRFHQPKTLKCMHTYCLQCIQKWVETHGKMKCPTCGQEHDLTKEDLQQLTSNTMITQLLEYAIKTEDQKPTKCSFCDNQPAYHCSTCQLYLCGDQCTKQHKALPSTRDHPLFTLDTKEQDGQPSKCPAHCNTPLEFYCSACNKSACKQCEHIFHCFQKHKVISMSTAIDKFNKDANEVVTLAHQIEDKLSEKLETITKERSEFQSQLNLCRTAIEVQERNLIKKVQAQSQHLISELENKYKEETENIDSEVTDIHLKMTQVNNLIVSLSATINKPEEIETLRSHKTTINAVKEKVLGTDFDQSFHKRISTPHFNPSTHLVDFGKITTVDVVDDMMYKVAEDCEAITVTKGETFVVKVSSPTENDACQLAATLINSSGEESATEMEYQGHGEYKITGRCNEEGDWQMMVTAGAEHIEGSPVNIKVEKLECVYTIDNISDYKKHNKFEKVTDVMLGTDGCILVLSSSNDILKFNQSGSFAARIQVPQSVVSRMHQMDDGHISYIHSNKYVNVCDDQWKAIRTYSSNLDEIKHPFGLTANKESRMLYIADREAHCVYKFNNGKLLCKIGSKGCEIGQLKEPQDVTVTKEGHVIVADFGNNRIQMFDESDMLMRACIIGCGEEDGKVMGPHGVTMDIDENLIVSSNHKLQLFDKNGVFIKRIDHEDDGLNIPLGCTVISNRPRKVAVANHGKNNVKIFKY